MLFAAACISPAIARAPRPFLLLLLDTPMRFATFSEAAFWALAGLTLLAAIVRHAASMVLVRSLALRMPDTDLARHARTTLHLAAAVTLIGLPAIYLSSGTLVLAVILLVASLAALAWFMLHFYVVERLRVRLGEIEAAARNAPLA